MIRSPECLRNAFSALLVLGASSAVSGAAFAQSAEEPPTTTVPGADAPADVESPGEQVWTCPMHAQIRQTEPGKCPICAMELTAVGENGADGAPQLMGLQEMLAIALEHNANVRAAQARVQGAEAELDRTRFEVLQQIMAFREKWQAQRAKVDAALQQWRAVESAAKNAHDAARQQLADSAKETYFQRRAKLAEIEAELPFLLGHASGKAAPKPGAARRKLIQEELLPKAREILALRTREYTSGNASVLDVIAAHRQVAELEALLATTNQQKIAAVETQKKLLQDARAVAEQLYRAGRIGQGDVLVVDLELSKMDLRLLDLKDD